METGYRGLKGFVKKLMPLFFRYYYFLSPYAFREEYKIP